MKVAGHGQAKVLSQQEIKRLFDYGFPSNQYRVVCAVMLFTACRVNEACTLMTHDIYLSKSEGIVRDEIIFRKKNTKGALATRTIPTIEDLRIMLQEYHHEAGIVYLFPGRDKGYIHPDTVSRILRTACRKVGIDGASTHSFRRTALTQMSNAGIPLRIIQEISGHRNLEQLQKYLEVKPEQVRGAISSLSMLSPEGKSRESISIPQIQTNSNELPHRKASVVSYPKNCLYAKTHIGLTFWR